MKTFRFPETCFPQAHLSVLTRTSVPSLLSTLSAVEDADDTYKVTFSAAPAAAKEGAILTLYPKSVGKAGVKANALLYCDICLDPYATACLGDAVWFCEYPVLARRTFPITDDIKTQLREAGCAFYFSNRK